MNIVPVNVFNAFSSGKMLSIIFFAIIFGYFISRSCRSSRKTMTGFFNAVFDVMMKITMFRIRFTPLGVFAIMAVQVSKLPDIIGLAKNMGLYMFTVLLALVVHFVISLPLLTKFIGKVNPLKHFRAVTTPLLTAFSTSFYSAIIIAKSKGEKLKIDIKKKY